MEKAPRKVIRSMFDEALKLADDLKVQHRYSAACTAVLAGCGQGKDANQTDVKERARLRQQALDWLRADLEGWSRSLEKDTPQARLEVQRTLAHWRSDTDLASLREPAALAKLPDEERRAWQKLWADVDALLKRSEGKAGPPAKG